MSVCALILFFGRLRAPRPPPFADHWDQGFRSASRAPCLQNCSVPVGCGVAVADAEARERRNQCSADGPTKIQRQHNLKNGIAPCHALLSRAVS